MTPPVSVVLPVRNEERSLEACLRSLVAQDLPPDRFEILIVDGRSTDRTRSIAAAWAARDPRIRVLDNPGRIAPTALNIGVREARGSIIARMDGHAVAPPDYLSRGVEVLAATGAWSAGGQMVRVGRSPATRAIAAVTMSPFGVGDAAHNFSTAPMWAETVFLGMWPRWVFERVGLFDEELVRNQDDELSYRIREAGGRIRFDPRIAIEYEPRASLGHLFSQYRQYAMWKVRVWQMHPASLRWRHWVPMLWVGTMAVGAGLGFLVRPGWLVAAGAAGAYLVVVGAGAWRLASRAGLPAGRLLATFACLHLAYGLGFWQGLVRFAPRWVRDRRGRPPALGETTAP